MCTADSHWCERPRDASTDLLLLQHGYYQDEPASKLLLIPHTGNFSQVYTRSSRASYNHFPCQSHSYLRQGGYVFVGLCLFVWLPVSPRDNSKSYGPIFLKFWEHVGHGISYKWFNVVGDPAGILDSESLWNFHYHCIKGGIREPLAKRRWWRHLANSFALAEVPAGYDCFSSF